MCWGILRWCREDKVYDTYADVGYCESYMNKFVGDFTKADLKHGMLVRTYDSRWGMVIKEDASDKDCIKFFYDDKLLTNHGF